MRLCCVISKSVNEMRMRKHSITMTTRHQLVLRVENSRIVKNTYVHCHWRWAEVCDSGSFPPIWGLCSVQVCSPTHPGTFLQNRTFESRVLLRGRLKNQVFYGYILYMYTGWVCLTQTSWLFWCDIERVGNVYLKSQNSSIVSRFFFIALYKIN